MDIDSVRRYFSLFLAAISIFALIFIMYSIVVISKIAQDRKKKQEIQKGYAVEKITPSPTPLITR
ncbi:hypothetical protein A2954_01730 [Candidatus Roizmanbacteria bacterium RIFCSPLOWO2_01_FULL_37_12]|uniref:Uncharacterized protein n=1 Tax=Candidatus Roizmanbacteria bacterium RIFCSPLOWO2_01_FULL_37_12 TaxID=1802056 RepID=A0A1F7I9B8_9BACT|nr:MAG: hypothetical protein A2768_01030 [Candidatus Roizmanbacteria bacterium RIFCSPHIGHO2_01_FULL_37_16]OGK23107.1 MAG: hypothetical protein A3D76_05875 [Candidatus Roizmanbacteria bacterium RIFCSPHIGHO2_02_FULL_37_9b]OGK39968.1 MAG: hypothetical protein A2954_01730 [Candidatus Roizmanbacteria bacterium RIFCSPLOWO2_01_FULL_37_12]